MIEFEGPVSGDQILSGLQGLFGSVAIRIVEVSDVGTTVLQVAEDPFDALDRLAKQVKAKAPEGRRPTPDEINEMVHQVRAERNRAKTASTQ